MTIAATYENGVFKPVEQVELAEGTMVEVSVPGCDSVSYPESVRDLPVFGLWSGRDDIGDGVAYEDRIRQPRY